MEISRLAPATIWCEWPLLALGRSAGPGSVTTALAGVSRLAWEMLDSSAYDPYRTNSRARLTQPGSLHSLAKRRLAEGPSMAAERIQRRLAAILAADVVGYSRLMEADEAGTLAALRARRSEVLQPVVSRHRGRVVKLM